MKILAIRLGTWGAVLGMLAGVVELSLGAHIRPVDREQGKSICSWMGDLAPERAGVDDRPHGAEAYLVLCRRQIGHHPWDARACGRVLHYCWDALVPARNPALTVSLPPHF